MLFEEIKDDILHILICVYAYKTKADSIDGTVPVKVFLADIISLNALAEMIILRVARLGDKGKSVRSIKNMKKHMTNESIKRLETKFNSFFSDVQPVLDMRHEQIAHMKQGTLTSYDAQPIPACVTLAICSLVALFDDINEKPVNYLLSLSSVSNNVNLREELFDNVNE